MRCVTITFGWRTNERYCAGETTKMLTPHSSQRNEKLANEGKNLRVERDCAVFTVVDCRQETTGTVGTTCCISIPAIEIEE